MQTSVGNINIRHLGHGSILLESNGVNIYVDPYSDVHDYSNEKKADIILLTHAHTDHYDCKAIKCIANSSTEFVVSKSVGVCLSNDLPNMEFDINNNSLNVDPSTNLENMISVGACNNKCVINVLNNGEKLKVKGVDVEAVPAYNINQKRDNGNPFHIKGEGNGYILSFGGLKIYFAGDTELIPELSNLNEIDIAFLPKNEPYTLSDQDFIKAANIINPKNLFPIHYFELDKDKLLKRVNSQIRLYV